MPRFHVIFCLADMLRSCIQAMLPVMAAVSAALSVVVMPVKLCVTVGFAF